MVIIAAEYDGNDSGLYALDARTGKRVWKVPRPHNLNFASPIIATIAGQRQVLLAGADMMVGYDPQTGRELWKVNSSTEAICGTMVWDGRRVLVSGGNPKAGTWCVLGDGSSATALGERSDVLRAITADNRQLCVRDCGQRCFLLLADARW